MKLDVNKVQINNASVKSDDSSFDNSAFELDSNVVLRRSTPITTAVVASTTSATASSIATTSSSPDAATSSAIVATTTLPSSDAATSSLPDTATSSATVTAATAAQAAATPAGSRPSSNSATPIPPRVNQMVYVARTPPPRYAANHAAYMTRYRYPRTFVHRLRPPMYVNQTPQQHVTQTSSLPLPANQSPAAGHVTGSALPPAQGGDVNQDVSQTGYGMGSPPPPYGCHNYNVPPPAYDTLTPYGTPYGTPYSTPMLPGMTRDYAVAYQSQFGQPVVNMRPVVVASATGHVIVTPQPVHDFSHPGEKPLTERSLRNLRRLTVFACIVFFPLGILAFVFASRARTQFAAAIADAGEGGEVDLKDARSDADKAARLVVASIFTGLLVLVLLAIIVIG